MSNNTFLTAPGENLKEEALLYQIENFKRAFSEYFDHDKYPESKGFNDIQAAKDISILLSGEDFIQWEGPIPVLRYAPAADNTVQLPSAACLRELGVVSADCFALVLQCIGLTAAVSRAVGSSVIASIPANVVTSVFQDLVQALADAKGIWAQAKAIFQLFKSVYQAVGLKKIMEAIKNNVRWYDWIKIGIIISAQLAALFLTDGTLVIAQIVLVGAAVATVVADAINAVNVCRLPNRNAAVATSQLTGPAGP